MLENDDIDQQEAIATEEQNAIELSQKEKRRHARVEADNTNGYEEFDDSEQQALFRDYSHHQ